MPKVQYFTRYNRPPQVGLDTGSDSIVDQAQKELCDINVLFDRYTNEGTGLPVNNRPIYGDFTQSFTIQDVFDLRGSLDTLYASMPKTFRDRNTFLQFADKLTTSDDDTIYEMFNPDRSKTGRIHSSNSPTVDSVGDSSVSSPEDASASNAT